MHLRRAVQAQPVRYAVFGGERPQSFPCSVLDEDAFFETSSGREVFKLARVEDLAKTRGRRRGLEIANKLRDLPFEILQRLKGLNAEGRDEAAIIMTA